MLCALGALLCSCAALVPSRPVKPSLGKDTWISYDGKEMPWQAGKPVAEGRARAVVITVHGLSGAALTSPIMQSDAAKTLSPEARAHMPCQSRRLKCCCMTVSRSDQDVAGPCPRAEARRGYKISVPIAQRK